MKILITGHLGYLGSYIYFKLKTKNYDIYGIDLKNGKDFFNYDFDEKFDYIIHCAAIADARANNSSYVFLNNYIKSIDFIERAFQYNSNTKFIFISSSNIHIKDYNSYGLSKYLVEHYLGNSYYENWVSIRFYNIIGPSIVEMPHFRLYSKLKNNNLKALNTNVKRNYVCINDCYRFIEIVMDHFDYYKRLYIDFHSDNNILSNYEFVKFFFPNYDLSNVDLIELPNDHWEHKVPLFIENNFYIKDFKFMNLEQIRRLYEDGIR